MISKKDLLALTGISYGQLYRWKRMGLIPEEWFVRRAAYTGQETFFPREKVLARLEKILQMKDGASLQQLAEWFSPGPETACLTVGQACAKGVAPAAVFEIFSAYPEVPQGENATFDFATLLFIHVLGRLLKQVSAEESHTLYALFCVQYPAFRGAPCELLVLRKFGVCVGMLVRTPFTAVFDEETQVLAQADLVAACQELKVLLL